MPTFFAFGRTQSKLFIRKQQFAKKYGLNSIRECAVYPKPNKSPHRILIEFSRSENKQLIKESLVIEEAGRHNYSEDYKKLTREFYTIFE